MAGRRLSRQEFIALGMTAVGTSALVSCDFLATDPKNSGGSAPSPAGRGKPNGREAPSLAQQVKAGDLPAVDERLPENPRVIQPVDQIGRYGGTWRTTELGESNTWLYETVGYEYLVAWDPKWEKIIPNVAESFEIRNGGSEYVFTLRKGMKWSDGQPLTADDIEFWYEAIFTNKEITPAVPTAMTTANGKPVVLKKLDDFRVSFRFPEPNGLFLQALAIHAPTVVPLVPRHYLERFHKDFNPDVDELAKQEGVAGWRELFLQKSDVWNNLELPRLTAWLPKDQRGGASRMVWERNPYYFKVDPNGSQLPYIDKVDYQFFENEEVLILRCARGDIDMFMRAQITIDRNRPVLASSQKSGSYHLLPIKGADMNTMGICLNLNHPDPVKREMYQNKDFRIGLSHAINRQEIIDVVYLRQGEPWQTAPLREAPFFSNEMAKQYTEFDLAKANEYLDRAGYSRRDRDGMRLGSDGQPISIRVLTQSYYYEYPDVAELIKNSWAKVGIGLRIDNVTPDLAFKRMESNNYECLLDKGELGYLDMIGDPRWMFAKANSSFAPLWSNWYEGVEPQEEPPEAMKRQIEIYRSKVIPAIDTDDIYAGMREIIKIAADEFWTMGISLPADPYAIVKNGFRNVPEDMWLAFKCPYPAVTNVCQYFIEE